MELLDIASVTRGDGNWMSGYQYDAPGCAMHSSTSEICDGGTRHDLTNGDVDPDEATACGVEGYPFGVITSIRTRSRDLTSDPGDWVGAALDAESEKALGRFMFEGIDGAGTVPASSENIAWLGADSVRTVPAGATPRDSVAAALEEFWATATGVRQQDTLLHLGLEQVWALSVDLIGPDFVIRGTKVRIVTSSGYPTDAIGVTGPVSIRMSTDQDLNVHDFSVNDRETEANRIVALEFDPCHAVRVE